MREISRSVWHPKVKLSEFAMPAYQGPQPPGCSVTSQASSLRLLQMGLRSARVKAALKAFSLSYFRCAHKLAAMGQTLAAACDSARLATKRAGVSLESATGLREGVAAKTGGISHITYTSCMHIAYHCIIYFIELFILFYSNGMYIEYTI